MECKKMITDVLFYCLPQNELTFSSIEELLKWYKNNPGKYCAYKKCRYF